MLTFANGFFQSHFLKVPSLPFYSLVSVLSKFPSDIDSRVFWNFTLRDLIFGKLNVAVLIVERRSKSLFFCQKLLMVNRPCFLNEPGETDTFFRCP